MGFAAFSLGPEICSTPNISTPKSSLFPGGEERDPFPLGSRWGQMGWVTLQQLPISWEAWTGAQPLDHEMREN